MPGKINNVTLHLVPGALALMRMRRQISLRGRGIETRTFLWTWTWFLHVGTEKKIATKKDGLWKETYGMRLTLRRLQKWV